MTGGPVKKNASNSTPVTSAPIPSFSSYKKIKEAERRSHFEPKLKKKKIEKKEEVLINVGLMDVDFTGSLKRVFGKTLPVKLSTDMNYDEVLERSLKNGRITTEHSLNKNEIMCLPTQIQIWHVPFLEQMKNSH